MEVEFFDSLEAAQARLRQAMEAADARVKPWQAAVKVGDCFRRHAALALAMITWVEVWTRTFRDHLSARPFAAKLAEVREEAVMQTIFASGPRRKGSRRIAATLATLFSAATRVA
jgi:hypothetical protein